MGVWPGLEGIADGIPRTAANPYKLGTKKYWAVADALFERFTATMPERRGELEELAGATGGPALDGSPASLGPLEEWYLRVTSGPFDDGAAWEPTWQGLGGDTHKQTGLSMDVFWRLVERVAVYYADVAMAVLPGSRWVCWRAELSHVPMAGAFLLDIGAYPHASNPLNMVRRIVAGREYHAEPNPSGRPRLPAYPWASLPGQLDRDRRLRDERVAEHGGLLFQAAPTGPAAGKGRGPYKGRLRSEAQIKLGLT
jgi:hypothetical protein